MKRLQQSFLTASIALAQSMPGTAFAQALGAKPTGVPAQFGTLQQIIRTTFNITIVVSGIIFVLLLLLGGVQYLTSLGNEDATVKSRKTMINGAIGLVIVLTAYAIGNYILELLGITSQVQQSINTGGSLGF